MLSRSHFNANLYIRSMKNILFGCLSIGSLLPVHAQDSWRNPLLIDSATHRVAYTGVVEVAGTSKAELYSRAREWFAASFVSAKAVLEMDDREAGKLVGNASSQFIVDFGGILGQSPITLWRRIRVEVKEGKYRYSLTDFATTSASGRQVDANNVETWFKPGAASFNKDGTPKRAPASVISGVQKSALGQAASLKEAMTKGVGKDW
jgi:hypothetical protein